MPHRLNDLSVKTVIARYEAPKALPAFLDVAILILDCVFPITAPVYRNNVGGAAIGIQNPFSFGEIEFHLSYLA
jgi:hypothetical protein